MQIEECETHTEIIPFYMVFVEDKNVVNDRRGYKVRISVKKILSEYCFKSYSWIVCRLNTKKISPLCKR